MTGESKMRKTLLLVFLHGFKGGDDTFEKFPEHLRVLIADILPKINVLSVVYPRYETRGELNDCVARFKEWYVGCQHNDGKGTRTHALQAAKQDH